MTRLLVLHVEDNPQKAGAIRRGIAQAAQRLGLACDVHREATLQDANTYLLELLAGNIRPDVIVTDWSFPVGRGSGEESGLGALVVERARALDVPCLVLSGSDPPPSFTGRWGAWGTGAPGAWVEDLVSVLALASARRFTY